jgi:4-amino-4-deoxy-L-arabinose transferase-like glycosyltransferase
MSAPSVVNLRVLITHATRILAAVALIARLAGVGRGWLPSSGLLALLLVAAHVAGRAPDTRRTADWREFLKSHAFPLALGAMTVLAVLVRLPGIDADIGHTPLDIDEGRLAASVKHFFDTGGIDHRTVEHYPGAVFWLFAGAAFLGYVRDLTNGIELPPDQIPVASFVLAARLANVFLGAAIVAVTGLIGRRIAGAAAGLVAAALVAIVPLSVETTTVVRNDPGMVLAVLASVYAALLFHDSRRRSSLVAAAVLAGVATAIKYSSMFALVPVLIAAATGGTLRQRIGRSAVAILGFCAAIAVTNHFVWADFPNFLRQLAAQVALTARGHWAATANPSAFYMMVLERFGPGTLVLWLAGAFAIYALCTRKTPLWIVLSFPLLYLWFMTQRPAQFPRWVFPLAPFVAIAGAAALQTLSSLAGAAIAGRSRRTVILSRVAAGAIAAAVLAQPAWSGLVDFSRRVTPPTHTLVEQWLDAHAAPGSVVASDLHFLNFSHSKLTVRRLDFETIMPAGAIEQLAGSDWLVVPEPYFGNPMLRRLGFVQRFHAERSFGGHMGYDFEVYAVPKMPQPVKF